MTTAPAPMELRARSLANALVWHTAAGIGTNAATGRLEPEVTALVGMLTLAGFRGSLVSALQMQATDLTPAQAEAERITFAAHELVAGWGRTA